ncbi:two pore domain potassium channel family protein [Acidobacteria bacterium AB60]|nr:two pore domain potassium channel family protein [Acidobacteria bacterium AB60]
MQTLAMVAGIACIFIVLLDAFQTIILPRRAIGRVRLTRLFYIFTWPPWVFLANRLPQPRKRETAFSYYGPLSLILLLVVWAALILLGFGLLFYSLDKPMYDLRQRTGFWSDLYISGTAIFTLGPTDAGPLTGIARWIMVVEAGTGFGFLAVIMGYFPVLYGAFSRREVSISLLDARAGSPPTASELLRRHAHPDAAEALSILLTEWERWSAELLESHISFPLLCYFRSQHTNQSWISALTCILDTSALLIAGVQGHEARQAQLTFAMARHAMVDLSQVLTKNLATGFSDRLPPERYNQLYASLCQAGVSMCRDGSSEQRLRELRRLYEPYAETLSRYFCMPLPPWIPEVARKDNWLTVAKLREKAEESNASPSLIAGEGHTHPVAMLHEEHEDF